MNGEVRKNEQKNQKLLKLIIAVERKKKGS